MITVKFISAEDTYSIRHKILRPNQEVDDCIYPEDSKESTFHVGAYKEHKLVGIASFYKENHSDIKVENTYRLRGMATDSKHRGQGIGTAVIHFSEEYLKRKGVKSWWCNARTTASPYYEKLGLIQIGEVFTILSIGPHVMMYKKLE
ncbi:GNAT family N-acetyltransferase [Rossellomorea aquimaris]|uniref:GNAT family N-acetyltransferase n=1 Tax=Rossellomorea aquimaris TaxID=189382 RepID=UPI0007D08DD4|nr:GNAT family N-acetyltransferase [Rossellomorea aquimaris]